MERLLITEAPQEVIAIVEVLERLQPMTGSCWFYGIKADATRIGFITETVLKADAHAEHNGLRILIAKLNNNSQIASQQALIETIWNPLARSYESVVNLVDIRNDPEFFELGSVQRPRVERWDLFDLNFFLSEIDEGCRRRILKREINLSNLDKLLERWFGEQLFYLGEEEYINFNSVAQY